VADRRQVRVPRRRARETALALLFSEEFGGSASGWPASLAEHLSEEPPEYTLRIVEGVRSRRDEIDERIGAASQHWRLERMSLIDRNVLRIGAWEILMSGEVDPAVAIDEAVEIARLYGDTDSPAFVNGVLDAVAKGRP